MSTLKKNLAFALAFFLSGTVVYAQSDILFEATQIQTKYLHELEQGFYGGLWIGIELCFFNADSIETQSFCIDENKINPYALTFNIPGNSRNRISNVRKLDPFNYLVKIELLPQQKFIDTVYIPIQHPIPSAVEAELNYSLYHFRELDFVAVRNAATIEYCISCTNEMTTKIILEKVK